MKHRRVVLVLTLVSAACGVSLAFFRGTAGVSRGPARPRAASPPPAARDSGDQARVKALLGKLPLYFVENRGQEDPRVAFSVPGRDTTVYFTSAGVTFVLTRPEPRGSTGLVRLASTESRPTARERWAVNLEFLGANPDVIPRGREETPATVNYFKGRKDEWKTGLRTYASVVYADLWAGIDLVYSGSSGRLKYTLFVKPGADPDQIRLAYRGASGVRLTEAGQLEVSTPAGGFADDRPYAYQEIGGRREEVSMAYALAGDSGAYGFQIGAFDRSRPLVLDPAFLVYAGYIGGGGFDFVSAIDIDSSGNAYVAGQTSSPVPGFPGTIGPDLTISLDSDGFVAKVKADGSGLVYAGYIGGFGEDSATAIAVDQSGNAYVAGLTSSVFGFPFLVGPAIFFHGGADAFVAKVKADGTGLVYSGFISGENDDSATGIAVDSAGNAYVAGRTGSDQSTFPVTVGPDLIFSGFEDSFVAKVKADGTGLAYCGYIGGSFSDIASAIAVDSAGNAYVAGHTNSDQTTFPVKAGPDLTFGGERDSFVAKVKADGTGLVYAGYIGGSDSDLAFAIAVDSAGNAYIGGATSSDETTFPVKSGPDLTFNGGSFDAFVAKVKPDGTGLVYAGYIGGGADDRGNGIAVDSTGNAYLVGETTSDQATFPVKVGPDLTFNPGQSDAFVAKVKADGTGLRYAGYIGGEASDWANGIAVDSAGNAYVGGLTTSDPSTFPATVGPALIRNGVDGFVAKVSGKPDLADSFLTIPSVAKRGGSFAVTSKAFNLALGTAPASTTRYFLSLDNAKSASDILMTGNKAVPILQPGENVQGGATVTIPNSTALDSYYVLACADATNAVAELDENNNCFPSVARMPVTLPDLQVISQSSAPASANPGNRITVSDGVKNLGLVDAGASATRYYLSTDTVRSAGDVRLTGSRSVPALAPQATSGFSVFVTIPSSTALGVYHILACSDDLSAVAETNENNNCRATADTMNLTSPAFAPPVELKRSGRVAMVTVLATCTDGAEVHLTVSVSQGDAFGEGNSAGKCTGNPERYPVSVPAHGPDGFTAGPAEVRGEAVVKYQGEILDDHTWTRVLNVVPKS